MSDKSQTTGALWKKAVAGGIAEAQEAMKADDPSAVQVWLGNAIGAARIEELNRRPIACSWEQEVTCPEGSHWDDGVPYCDKCGLYRQSVHRQRNRENAKRKA